ncbi:MAG: HigA family addiction module antidote protein [Deltaproteobacteria bacterium]|nr:HigA family addiction module antidote protein [Deltaproteobacteria bacterium]
MKKLKNIHPGEVLVEEFMKPLNITAYKVAKETHLSQTIIEEIIKGKKRITADMALRLSRLLGTTPHFWLGLQNDYDIEEEEMAIKKELKEIHQLQEQTI